MIIANPIYDVVFKRLMDDKKVAKFFIETLTSEEIIDIQIRPQEFTYFKELEKAENQDAIEAIKDKFYGLLGLAVYRLDFLATIKTTTGEHKKVLIEIQKAKNSIDLMRFRNYLAEQYKKQDEINSDAGIVKVALPIITIYLLGFKLDDIEASAIKVARQYHDLISNTILEQKNDFIEKLTHDCFIVQIPRIQPKIQSKLEVMLTLFEQTNFVDSREITKDYIFKVNDEVIQEMVEILHHAGTDPSERIEIEKEQEALRVFDLGMQELRRSIIEKEKILAQQDQVLAEQVLILADQEKALADQQQALADQKHVLAEQERVLADQERALSDQEKSLAEKEKMMAEKDMVMAEKDMVMAEKDKMIEELMRKLGEGHR